MGAVVAAVITAVASVVIAVFGGIAGYLLGICGSGTNASTIAAPPCCRGLAG